MTEYALNYDFNDEKVEKLYNDMVAEHVTEDFRARIMVEAAHILRRIPGYSNVVFNEDNTGSQFREKELAGVMVALHKVIIHAVELESMSRWDHLMKAVTG
jgi:hypothetical protein